MLAIAVAIGFFFLTWGMLHGEGEETPWITAGVGASILLVGAVILREVILRQAVHTHIRNEPIFAQKFNRIAHQNDRRTRTKLSIEQNASILNEIKQKSNAAKLLSKFSAGHHEVFELCDEYIERIELELKTISPGSPRLSSLLKGRKAAADLHKYHLLQWTQIEARSLAGEANSRLDTSERMTSSNKALGVVEFALEHYPTEPSLLESRQLLQEMVVSIRVSDHIEKAELAAYKNDYREALSLYRDALFYLGRDNVETPSRREAADRINTEINRIRLLEGRE